MDVLPTSALGATVGAEVIGVDTDRLFHDDAFPEACLYDSTSQREMHRTTLVGDEAILWSNRRGPAVGAPLS